MVSEETREKIEKVLATYPQRESALLRVFHLVQQEQGYLSAEAIAWVAEVIGIPLVRAYEVATFYTLYHRKPVGKHIIQVCTNLSCSLMGAQHLLDHLEDRLKIRVGETTPDGRFTLLTVQCLGSCGTAPVMQINDRYYENLDKERVDRILTELAEAV